MTDANGETANEEDASGADESEEDGRDEDTAVDEEYAVVLDHLPYGRPDDDRPQHQKPEVAYAVGEGSFDLFELTLTEDADVSIGDRLVVAPEADREIVSRYREIQYEDLSRGAEQELEYVVEEIVDRHAQRFLDYFTEAQPLTLRLHQLNILPGIGEKLRNDILDSRKYEGPFESFEDLEERVSGLHNPKQIVVDRIMEELTEDEIKYRAFTTGA
jgi:putative nucleotide binding protein